MRACRWRLARWAVSGRLGHGVAQFFGCRACPCLLRSADAASTCSDAGLPAADKRRGVRPHTRGSHLICPSGWRPRVLQLLLVARIPANRKWMTCRGCKPPRMSPGECRLFLRKPRPETGRTIIGASKSRHEQWLASVPAEAESAVCRHFLYIPFISTAGRTEYMCTRCSCRKIPFVFQHISCAETPNIGRRRIRSAKF